MKCTNGGRELELLGVKITGDFYRAVE